MKKSFLSILVLGIISFFSLGFFPTSTLGQCKPPKKQVAENAEKHDHRQMAQCCRNQDLMGRECCKTDQSKCLQGQISGTNSSHPMDHKSGDMKPMSSGPEMMKQHFTMMMNDADVRPVLLQMLKESAPLRQNLEKLLIEATK